MPWAVQRRRALAAEGFSHAEVEGIINYTKLAFFIGAPAATKISKMWLAGDDPSVIAAEVERLSEGPRAKRAAAGA